MPAQFTSKYFEVLHALRGVSLEDLLPYFSAYLEMKDSTCLLRDDSPAHPLRQLIQNIRIMNKRKKIAVKISASMLSADLLIQLGLPDEGKLLRFTFQDDILQYAHSQKNLTDHPSVGLMVKPEVLVNLHKALECALSNSLDIDFTTHSRISNIDLTNKMLTKRLFNAAMTLGRYYLNQDESKALIFFRLSKEIAKQLKITLQSSMKYFLNYYINSHLTEAIGSPWHIKNRLNELLRFKLGLKVSLDMGSVEAKLIFNCVERDKNIPACVLISKYLVTQSLNWQSIPTSEQLFLCGLKALYGIGQALNFDLAINLFTTYVTHYPNNDKNYYFNACLLILIATYEKAWLIGKEASIFSDESHASDLVLLRTELAKQAEMKSNLIQTAIKIYADMFPVHAFDMADSIQSELFYLLGDFSRLTKHFDDHKIIIDQFINYYKNVLRFYFDVEPTHVNYLEGLTQHIFDTMHTNGLLGRPSYWKYIVDDLVLNTAGIINDISSGKMIDISKLEINLQVLADLAAYAIKLEQFEIGLDIFADIDQLMSIKSSSLNQEQFYFSVDNLFHMKSGIEVSSNKLKKLAENDSSFFVEKPYIELIQKNAKLTSEVNAHLIKYTQVAQKNSFITPALFSMPTCLHGKNKHILMAHRVKHFNPDNPLASRMSKRPST